ncbi:hypothetical protein BH10PSE16_BH10PSE16_43800 [soil metagenome]
MSAKKPAKARKAKKKVTPCTHCKAFTVTPARNSRGKFVATKAKQKEFRF